MAVSRSRVRSVVADTPAIVREGLQMLLQAELEFQVIGEAVNGADVGGCEVHHGQGNDPRRI